MKKRCNDQPIYWKTKLNYAWLKAATTDGKNSKNKKNLVFKTTSFSH